jgi:hypothetical protein
MDTKLTLKLDQDTIERAKAFAKSANTSLSQLVEQYFNQLTRAAQTTAAEPVSPLVDHLYGIGSALPMTDDPENAYYNYLLEKHSPPHADPPVS